LSKQLKSVDEQTRIEIEANIVSSILKETEPPEDNE
jgi:hypothetical protein